MHALSEMCFEITGACPMACTHCSSFDIGQNRFDRSAFIPFSKVKEVVENFRQLGGQVLQISGGEPLLHPQLVDIIRLAKDLNLEVRLYTSGLVGLRPNEIRPMDQELAMALKTAGLDRTIFNLQGGRPSTHEKITKTPHSYEICLESMKACKGVEMWVGIHFVPMKENLRELEDVIRIAENFGLDEVGILRFVPQGRGEFYRKELELSAEEQREVAQRILDLQGRIRKLRIRTGSPMNFLTEFDSAYKPVPCSAGSSTCNITADGRVVPCPAFKKVPGFSVGDVTKETLRNIWENSPILKVLRQRSIQERHGECFAQIVVSERSEGALKIIDSAQQKEDPHVRKALKTLSSSPETLLQIISS